MKRLLALILAALLLAAAVLTGCGKSEFEEEIKGAEISMFLSTLPESIDPSAVYTCPDDIRIMGMLYEGLTTINEKGKLENALAKAWEYDFNQKTGNLELIITLDTSRWSDGNVVTSDDFRFAWQRILKPQNNNPNAALLYPVLNAQAAKEGLCSIDDIGVVCQTTGTLMITFEKSYVNEDDFSKGQVKDRVESFMRRLASPALVPLRQDVVDDDTHEWCEANGTSYVTNGAFKIKSWNTGELTFERSVNYKNVAAVDSNPDDKVVKPYRIITMYSNGATADAHLESYNAGETKYLNLNSASAETIEAVKGDMEEADLYSTFCLFLEVNNPDNTLFSDAKVRQALSLAIDREAIAKAVYASPATGFVPSGVDNTDEGTDFRKTGGELISKKADIAKAKQLLAEAGVNPKGKIIAIDYSNRREDDKAIVAECKKAWTELGFVIKDKATTQGYINSKVNGTYEIGKNNSQGTIVFASVVATNLQSVTPDALSVLTTFSGKFGGNVIDLTQKEVVYTPHFTGFYDEKYDELCEGFVTATDEKAKAAAMHEAEKYLVEQMPAIPVVFNKAYYASQKLSNLETDAFGRLVLTELDDKTYSASAERKALEEEAAAKEAEAEAAAQG